MQAGEVRQFLQLFWHPVLVKVQSDLRGFFALSGFRDEHESIVLKIAKLAMKSQVKHFVRDAFVKCAREHETRLNKTEFKASCSRKLHRWPGGTAACSRAPVQLLTLSHLSTEPSPLK